MMFSKIRLLVTVAIFSVASAIGQKAENVVVVTLDGFRWQELFGGADSVLINDSVFTSDPNALKSKYWAATPEERRRKLLPFFWNTIGKQGQLFGNRNYGNLVNVMNRYWFSYPGYNEIFTGYPDTSINSNDKNDNKNENVLEFIHSKKDFKGKVAAFSSWDAFDAILNEKRSGIFVSSGFDTLSQAVASTASLRLLNDMQQLSPSPLGSSVRPDFITYFLAKEYLKSNSPRVLYLSFDETDDYAHGGKYDLYLDAAHMTDRWLQDLWNWLQSQPAYRDKTTMLITTDHGRGDLIKEEWKHHGIKIKDADQIWIAAIGKGISPVGEVRSKMQLHQQQVAATIAKLLGFNFTAKHKVPEPIQFVNDHATSNQQSGTSR
jgi:hypothetical protein